MIRRILFDLDGTLWDTQKFHAASEAAIARSFGVIVEPDEISSRFAGIPTARVFRELLGCDEGLAQELTKKKWDQIIPRAAEAVELSDLRKLFTALTERGIKLSIGTASPVQWAKDLLELNNLSHFFEEGSVVGGDMVIHGKPDPEIWLKAGRGAKPSECFVVEDGEAGIVAAVRAGIPCALLLPRKHPAALEIKSLDEILQFV